MQATTSSNDPLSDPIVDTINNEPATDGTGFITTPFLGVEFATGSGSGKKTKQGINLAVESLEQAISEVNEYELDFLVMDISIHQQQQQHSTKSSPTNKALAPLLDLRQICHKQGVSSRQYLFRTTDWSHCMVGKVDEKAFQTAFGIFNTTNKKLLSCDKPYEVPGLDEYTCGTTSEPQTKKAKQGSKQASVHEIPSTAGSLSQMHLQAQAAKLILKQEIQWAVHLCIPAVLFPEPQNREMAIALGSFVNQILPIMGSTSIWIRFSAGNYHLWNIIRTMCDSHTLLVPVLELKNKDIEELSLSLKQQQQQQAENEKKKKKASSHQDATPIPENNFWNPFEKQVYGTEHPLVTSLSVWIAENVRTIILNIDLFAKPANGSTHILAEGLDQFISKSFKFDTQFVFSCAGYEDSSPNMAVYKRALMTLFSNCPLLSKVEVFSKTFRDVLQQPLQPLIDNLDSQTYEVFERDPIKYLLYEKSSEKALLDLYEAKKKRLGDENMRIIVMVVGAGRGPIVKAVLRAARTTKVPVHVYAVEKNPNALSHLLYYKKTIWSTFTASANDIQVPIVEIIQKDMRVWNPPEKADLLVSELLGSFSDNELSPECLDGAQMQRLLKENGEGVSIPTRYTSYISPLCSYKVWSEVKNLSKTKSYEEKAFETGYVVLVHRGVALDKPQRCFTFVHPNPQVTEYLKEKDILEGIDSDNTTLQVPLIDNSRYVSLRFKSQQNAVVHGLVGYFECQLYKDVWMSILPDTFSSGMFSWFPIVFPIVNPVAVKKGEDIGVQVWRYCDNDVTRKVWYEWCVTTGSGNSGSCSKIHNSNGKHYYISL